MRHRQRHIRAPLNLGQSRRPRRGKQTRFAVSERELVNGDASLQAWQASQNLIGQLRSENSLLQKRLKDCQLELRTVQRECKVQSARLSKVCMSAINLLTQTLGLE